MKNRKVIGCMTGTSMDGLDICLAEIEGFGQSMRVEILSYGSFELNDFKDFFEQISKSQVVKIPEYLSYSLAFGEFHAKSIKNLIGNLKVDLICVHGQTVFHKPPLSLQLMNANPIARELNTPVVYDLRAMDLACGGEGAPITPIADKILYQITDSTSIINFGGFCNYTTIKIKKREDEITGGDICVCNLFLNELCKRYFQQAYDEDGKIASSGKVDQSLFALFVSHLNKQSLARKSLGTNDELRALLPEIQNVKAPDVLATACASIAEVISQRVQLSERIILAGGGAKNLCLVNYLRKKLNGKVILSSEIGVPLEVREAACFAILGALCQDRVSIILPTVTGSHHSFISGAWVLP